MTDAHCHVTGGESSVREFLIGRDFIGIHPWEVMENHRIDEFRRRLEAESALGVGEIGLDRLKEREISPRMREVFELQLKLAFEYNRPVVLHGAKCWGQVVRTVHSAIRRFGDSVVSSFLFHGFSRSDGLIPDIVALNGYISVGPAVLNDHAVNYRELVKKIPLDRLLVETDRTAENAATCPSVRVVSEKVAELRGMDSGEFERLVDENAERFLA